MLICTFKFVKSKILVIKQELEHNLDLNEWSCAKNFDLGCRLCGLEFSTFDTWEKHFVKGKLCPLMPKEQPDVPIGHCSEEFYYEDMRQESLAQAFAIQERSKN